MKYGTGRCGLAQAAKRSQLDVKTTMFYTHVLNKGPLGVVSPVDTL